MVDIDSETDFAEVTNAVSSNQERPASDIDIAGTASEIAVASQSHHDRFQHAAETRARHYQLEESQFKQQNGSTEAVLHPGEEWRHKCGATNAWIGHSSRLVERSDQDQ